MKCAIISGGIVVNIIAISDDADPADFGAIPLPDGVGRGWVQDGETFVPPAVDLDAIRAKTFLSRADFAEALFDAAILTEAELLEWATGAIPSSVLSDLSAVLTGTDLVKAKARIMAVQQVYRTHEIVLLLQASRSLTDAQVDTLFGIGA